MTSQFDEDEIIRDIFGYIGVRHKNFVEFGCGDGRQNNTIALLKRGWSGLWFDPHKKRIESAKARWREYPVQIQRRLITPANVNTRVIDPLDFLSIDIDGNDYAVWEAITARPRLVCIEIWDKGGTPLDKMRRLGESKGYEFISTSRHGINAFFKGV